MINKTKHGHRRTQSDSLYPYSHEKQQKLKIKLEQTANQPDIIKYIQDSTRKHKIKTVCVESIQIPKSSELNSIFTFGRHKNGVFGGNGDYGDIANNDNKPILTNSRPQHQFLMKIPEINAKVNKSKSHLNNISCKIINQRPINKAKLKIKKIDVKYGSHKKSTSQKLYKSSNISNFKKKNSGMYEQKKKQYHVNCIAKQYGTKSLNIKSMHKKYSQYGVHHQHGSILSHHVEPGKQKSIKILEDAKNVQKMQSHYFNSNKNNNKNSNKMVKKYKYTHNAEPDALSKLNKYKNIGKQSSSDYYSTPFLCRYNRQSSNKNRNSKNSSNNNKSRRSRYKQLLRQKHQSCSSYHQCSAQKTGRSNHKINNKLKTCYPQHGNVIKSNNNNIYRLTSQKSEFTPQNQESKMINKQNMQSYRQTKQSKQPDNHSDNDNYDKNNKLVSQGCLWDGLYSQTIISNDGRSYVHYQHNNNGDSGDDKDDCYISTNTDKNTKTTSKKLCNDNKQNKLFASSKRALNNQLQSIGHQRLTSKNNIVVSIHQGGHQIQNNNTNISNSKSKKLQKNSQIMMQKKKRKVYCFT